MVKVEKISFYLLSLTPILWTIAMLIGAYLHANGIYGKGILSLFLSYVGLLYFMLGFWLWLVLTILYIWKKKISILEAVINIGLTVVGILFSIILFATTSAL